MSSAARKSANGIKTLANREIEWEFTVDRFGVRTATGDGDSLRVEFARKAVSSLSHWSKTVELLYGDAAGVIALATNAGFLPQYPYWQSVAQTIENTSGSVDAAAVARRRETVSRRLWRRTATRRRNRSMKRSSIRGPRIWSSSFGSISKPCRRGLRCFGPPPGSPALPGRGRRCRTPQGRLLQGLQSVIAVYELDATPDAAAIMKRFAGVLSGGGDAPSSLLPQLQSVLKQGENLLHYSGRYRNSRRTPPCSINGCRNSATPRVITRTNRPLSLRPLGMRSKTPIGRSGSGLRWGPCPG